jgi:DNA-binding PadR family transcriptional regulator
MAGDNVQMFILGSLTQGEAHGYQLVARARAWGVDDWAGFKTGSIYNALHTLEKRGLVAQLGTERHGGYAPATVYGITDEGQTKLIEMLHDAATEFSAVDPFDLVTAFFGLLPVQERQELIRAHADGIRRRVDGWELKYARMKERVEQGAPYDWVLAAIEKGRRVAQVATDASGELQVRCEQWMPPEPFSRSRCPEGTHAEPGAATHPESESDQPTRPTGGNLADR